MKVGAHVPNSLDESIKLGTALGIGHPLLFATLILSKGPFPTTSPQPASSEDVGFDQWDAAGQVVLARRPVHYEHASLKTLVAFDMPGLFIGTIISLPLSLALWMIGPSREAQSYPFDGFCCAGS